MIKNVASYIKIIFKNTKTQVKNISKLLESIQKVLKYFLRIAFENLVRQTFEYLIKLKTYYLIY